jgi:hypothetical protein
MSRFAVCRFALTCNPLWAVNTTDVAMPYANQTGSLGSSVLAIKASHGIGYEAIDHAAGDEAEPLAGFAGCCHDEFAAAVFDGADDVVIGES